MPRDAPVTIATLPSSSFSLTPTPDSSLRTSARRHRPAVDDLVAAADPDAVMEVESRPDLAGDEVEAAAELRRCGAIKSDGRVLVADEDLRGFHADRDRRSVLEPDHAPADVDHHPIRVPADDRAADRGRALERQIHDEQLRLHQAVDAGLNLRDGRIGDCLSQG